MPITLTLGAEGPPKRQLIELAFGEISSPGYEFGRTAEEVTDALLRLNALMYEWPYSTLGYLQPEYGIGEPDDSSGIPFEAMNGVAAALALRIAPVMGATLSPEAKANLATAMSRLYALTATIPTMPMQDNTPRGMGERVWPRTPFISETFDDTNPAS